MTKLTVVVAHPSNDSFTKALAQAGTTAARRAGATVGVQDLYADGFDPRMPTAEVGTVSFADALTAKYAAEVLESDALLIIHPVWFFQVPAILKGWVDRVLREGIVYRLGSGGKVTGLLKARAALVVNPANSGDEVEQSLGEPLEQFWRQVVFGFGGVSDVRRLRLGGVAGSSVVQRESWLKQVAEASAALVRDTGSSSGGAEHGA